MGLQVAAPPFYVQLFFHTARGNGFSEAYWVNAPDYDAAMDRVMDQPNCLYDVRRECFTDAHSIPYVRVSDSTKKRDTVIRAPEGANSKGTYVPVVQDTEADETALLARVEGVDAGIPIFALRPLRLIPEECVTNGVFVPTNPFSLALSHLETELIANYSMVTKSGGVPVAFPITDVKYTHMSRRKVGRPFGLSAGRSRRP